MRSRSAIRSATAAVAGSVAVAAAIAVGSAQGRLTPPQFAGGSMPVVPLQTTGGGHVFVEATITESGTIGQVRALRTTPPFTEALTQALSGWAFRPAEVESPASGSAPAQKKAVATKVLVASIFRRPSYIAPTVGEPPKDVATASAEVPYPIVADEPPHPQLARALDGVVLVEVQIDRTGKVTEARILRSVPPFDDAALSSARRWTFRPARSAGLTVASVAYLVFAFRQPVS
jgi:TonB family protein